MKRPLLCVIHGGPTGTDMPSLPDRNYYPIEHWVGSVRAARSSLASELHSSKECQQESCGQGAIVLKVNVSVHLLSPQLSPA